MSTAEENKAFIRRYLEAINGKDKTPTLVDQFVANSDVDLKQHIAGAEAAFPRYEFVPEAIIAEGDKVVVRFTMRGTHRGDFFGVAPTGKQVSVPGIIIYSVADSKITQHWVHWETGSLMQQLGATS